MTPCWRDLSKVLWVKVFHRTYKHGYLNYIKWKQKTFPTNKEENKI